jgi:anion-transporting  ArsA/GET3 family ATPase
VKIFDRKLLILCGTGGVGKTTLSAALAVKAACAGKHVALITIDPAKRLATSLGLNSLAAEPQDITNHLAKAIGTQPKGTLHALMLDSHDTLFKFLEKVGGKDVLQKFKESQLFSIISDNFAGTHDYLAMEKLYELHHSDMFDLILLDTPPARHTLDFLSVPDRIARFFDDRIFHWFMTAPKDSSLKEKLRAKGTSAALGIMEKITGDGVIHDFVSLAPYIYKVKNAFVERQKEIQSLIRSKEAGAVFVSSPTELSRGEAGPFIEDAKAQRISVLAYLINRSLQYLCPQAPTKSWPDDGAVRNYKNLYLLVEEEKRNIRFLEEVSHQDAEIFLIPELEKDIHDIISLYELSKVLPNHS